MNKVYKITFDSKHSNKKFELHIYKPSLTPIITSMLPTYVSGTEFITLPTESVSIESLGFEFDKLPLGINSDTTLDITWFYDYLPSDFKTILFNNKLELEDSSGGTTLGFKTGNIYTLIYDDQVIYRGVQYTDIKHNHSINDKTLKVSLSSLSKFILTRIDFGRFVQSLALTTYDHKCIFEYYNNTTQRSVVRMPSSQYKATNAFKFVKLYDFQEALRTQYQNLLKEILRLSTTEEVAFQLPKLKYYTQDGMQLSYNDIYLLAYVYVNNKNIGGLFSNAKDGFSRYSTVYDFLSDLSQDSLSRFFARPDGYVMNYPMLNSFSHLIEATKFEIESYSLNQLTVSLEEYGSRDVERYEFKDATTRNSEDFTIPIMFNTAPPNWSDREPKLFSNNGEHSTILGLSSGKSYIVYEAARQWNLYYIDAPTGFSSARPFNVSGYCEYDSNIKVVGTEPTFDIDTFYLGIQREYSKPLMYKELLSKLGDEKSYILKTKFELENINLTDYFFGANYRYYFDFNSIDTSFNYPTYYYLTKAELNIKDEIIECEFMGWENA